MPYIDPKRRGGIDETLSNVSYWGLGDIAYDVWKLLKMYQRMMGESYHTHTAILGLLDSLKQEWYRREVAPYEEYKRERNGDVS